MAIQINNDFYSIIIKAESVIRIYGENGFETFLKEFFPNPPKKKKVTEKEEGKNWCSLFSKKKATQDTIKEECSIEDYSFIQCYENFNQATHSFGHDGNLIYMSYLLEDDMSACCVQLNKKGFYGYKSVIYVEDVDYVVLDKNGFPISIKWLETIEKNKGSENTAPYYVYSISPFKTPICPSSFPSIQGGIRYETILQWDLGQKYIQKQEFNKYRELRDVSLIYTNCNLGGRIKESEDDWFRAYEQKLDLSTFSGDMEYKLLSVLGNCIHTCNFIPLYHFLDSTPISRLNIDKAERTISKFDLTVELTKKFQKAKKTYFEIQFQSGKNKYIGVIKGQGVKEIASIYTYQNKITALWIVQEIPYILPKGVSQILSQIAAEWNHGNPLYIERYLSEDYKYTFFGERNCFGNHILNKRQYIIWWESAYEIYADAKVRYYSYTHENERGIICHDQENGSKMRIRFNFADGVIISAEEIISTITSIS